MSKYFMVLLKRISEDRSQIYVIKLLALLLSSLTFFSANAFSLNDPTRTFSSVPTHEAVNENLKLQGVFRRKNKNTAIINGKAFLLGDKVFAYTLKKIGKHSVELSRGNRRLVLELRENMRD